MGKIAVFGKMIFGYCGLHGWFKYPYTFRSNTNYVDDELNFEKGCHLCQDESNDYWNGMWESIFEGGSYMSNKIDRKKWLCKILNLWPVKK